MKPRITHLQVLDLLATAGRMTRIEIELATGASRQWVGEVLRDLQGMPPRANRGHTRRDALPRQVRISNWQRDNAGGAGRYYLRPVYCLGVAPDAKHPGALTDVQIEQRYRARKSLGRRVASAIGNSVFNWTGPAA